MKMLRLLGARRRSLASVASVTVKITFIDHEGSRAVVPGRVGMTVADVAKLHDIDIGPVSMAGPREVIRSEVWTEELFGEGPVLGYDHVQIPPAWRDGLPPKTAWEQSLLKTYWDDDDLTDASRLASMLTLSKHHDGITIYIPDGIPADGQF
mmetsp:Transcript_7016/g.22922  ORF Transcript_7016/g.22922 Transcript_7016/m.22922 type:complete len:152 (+) Transcript_7016:783-1238(+)|eukprot:CAMPEP_0118908718 /NCGR_PEP_ID=MMETSP1166-20130328/11609_1 /TAXON_ID=1104430 /ORGANISM="Chrysoreinhardia sp, Strain CCMP3193" /LENGTH=151 /DNA_ID=CAMNT_0006848117 /DNA_START=51 /DNA_END=506 /DNA_ORIENTATION=+